MPTYPYLYKAADPNGIHPKVLRTFIAEPLAELFNLSLLTADVPEDWRTATSRQANIDLLV